MESFIGTADKALAVIAAALVTDDHTMMRDAAHVLKGASANLRASAATSAAAQLEEAAASGEGGQISALAHKLETEIKRTSAYLQSKVEG